MEVESSKMSEAQTSTSTMHPWRYENRSASPCSSPSTPTTMDANEELSTASESELDSPRMSNSEDTTEDNEDDYSNKRRRKGAPPIFFGTPCQAEHENRAKYTTKMQCRRLLRKDSLELTRRKSSGLERSRVEREGSGPTVSKSEDCKETGEDVHNERKFPLSKQVNDYSFHETDGEDEKSSDTASEDENTSRGDKTIRIQDEFEGDSLDDQIPSTPTKQIIRRLLSRPSLAISDADSSPGIALTLHPSPATRASPFSRPSPSTILPEGPTRQCPRSRSPPKFQPDVLEWSKDCKTTPGRQDILKESPIRLNQAFSPSKSAPSSSSLTKVVVRQTLSAWAHSKLKTPQSPEKKEWERLQQSEGISPSRNPQTSSHSASVSKTVASALNTSRTATSSVPSQDKVIRPPSRIARPVQPSRLPVPIPAIKSATASLSTESAKRIVMPNTAPSFRRIATHDSASSGPRSFASSTSYAGSSRSVPQAVASKAQSSQSKAPFRAPLNLAKPLDRSLVVRPMPPSSSSPIKAVNVTTAQRGHGTFSSPFKRPFPVKVAAAATTTTTTKSPIVRDARLIAAPRRHPESGPPITACPAPSRSPSTGTLTFPFSLPSSSPSSTPLQSSAGVGGARRVIVGRGTIQPVETARVKMTARPDRADVEKREIRIKEITMGRNITPAQSPLKEIVLPQAKAEDPSTIKSQDEERKLAVPSESAKKTRPTRKKQEKTSIGKVRKVTPSSSIFPSSKFVSDDAALPLSRVDLSRLTSLHTRRNEIFTSQLEIVIVRKKGESRPASPSSKIRKIVTDTTRIGGQSMTKGAAKENRERHAKRRTFKEGEVEEYSDDHDQERHMLGAGDDELFTSPTRICNQDSRRIRWHKSLFRGPSDVNRVSVETKSNDMSRSRVPLKSCLCKKAFDLDNLGNIILTNQALSPRLTKNKVTIYKVIYDDDEDQYL